MRRSGRKGGLPDHIRPGARVLFVGINPGLRSAAVGHHFAGPSNRFWRLMCESGLLPERLGWADDARLPLYGYGITNLVRRATAGIDALRAGEYRRGRRALLVRIRRYRPEVVALVGLTIDRVLFPGGLRAARPGLRRETLAGSAVFVLPNPSGRNATITYAAMLSAFRALRRHLERTGPRPGRPRRYAPDSSGAAAARRASPARSAPATPRRGRARRGT